MKEVKNLNNKRVCDLSADGRTAVIQLKDCVTKIYVASDGTLKIVHSRIADNVA